MKIANKKQIDSNLIGYAMLKVNGTLEIVNLHSETASFGDCSEIDTTIIYRNIDGECFFIGSDQFKNISEFYTV